MLAPSSYSNCEWNRDGERVANFQIRAMEGSVALAYRSRVNGGDWTQHNEHVVVSWSYVRKLGMVLSGGVFDLFDYVLERDPLDEFGELV